MTLDTLVWRLKKKMRCSIRELDELHYRYWDVLDYTLCRETRIEYSEEEVTNWQRNKLITVVQNEDATKRWEVKVYLPETEDVKSLYQQVKSIIGGLRQ